MTNFIKEIIQLFTDFREDQKIENRKLRELILLSRLKPAAEGHTIEKKELWSQRTASPATSCRCLVP